jgi:hypothetical protein
MSAAVSEKSVCGMMNPLFYGFAPFVQALKDDERAKSIPLHGGPPLVVDQMNGQMLRHKRVLHTFGDGISITKLSFQLRK